MQTGRVLMFSRCSVNVQFGPKVFNIVLKGVRRILAFFLSSRAPVMTTKRRSCTDMSVNTFFSATVAVDTNDVGKIVSSAFVPRRANPIDSGLAGL